jgi:hypothetical protein
MSKEQKLTVLPSQEDAIVEHYPAQSHEIIPGLELTLAKRILRPGTNRVVCLAARTSVPFNDNDESASVSDVALKLSDGTNVRLSVSMFNDIAGAGYAPFKHYVYDPSRYTSQSDPKVFALIFAMLLVGWTAYCSLSTESLRRAQWTALLHAYNSRPLTSLPATYPVKKAAVKSIDGMDKAKSLKSIPIKAVKPDNFANLSIKRNWSARASQIEPRAAKNKSFMPATMLIPPPPPVPYSLSDRNMFFQYNPAQLVKPAVPLTKPVSAAAIKDLELSNHPVVPSSAVRTQFRETSLPQVSQNDGQLERIPALSSSTFRAAPLPGPVPTLERIVPPAESVLR